MSNEDVSGSNELAAPTEAVQAWAQTWEPENTQGDGSAQKMRKMIAGVANHQEAEADAFDQVAGKIEERILLDDGGAELVRKVAQNVRSQVEPIRECLQQIDAAHEERLRNMTSDDPRAGSWDWRANQEDMLA